MTYVSVITLVTYALVLGLLAVVSVIDVRSRRVPNVLAGALGLLWLAWRVVLGFAGAHMGLGFRAEFLGPAPDVLVPRPGNRRHLLCERHLRRCGARRGLARADDGLRACSAQGGFRRRRYQTHGRARVVSRVGARGYLPADGVRAQCRLCVWPRDWPPSDGAKAPRLQHGRCNDFRRRAFPKWGDP